MNCDLHFAGPFLCVVEWRRSVLLGSQFLWPGCAILKFVVCSRDAFFVVLASEMRCEPDLEMLCAAWRQLPDQSTDSRGCSWLEQRSCHGCLGRGIFSFGLFCFFVLLA